MGRRVGVWASCFCQPCTRPAWSYARARKGSSAEKESTCKLKHKLQRAHHVRVGHRVEQRSQRGEAQGGHKGGGEADRGQGQEEPRGHAWVGEGGLVRVGAGCRQGLGVAM